MILNLCTWYFTKQATTTKKMVTSTYVGVCLCFSFFIKRLTLFNQKYTCIKKLKFWISGIYKKKDSIFGNNRDPRTYAWAFHYFLAQGQFPRQPKLYWMCTSALAWHFLLRQAKRGSSFVSYCMFSYLSNLWWYIYGSSMRMKTNILRHVVHELGFFHSVCPWWCFGSCKATLLKWRSLYCINWQISMVIGQDQGVCRDW